MGTIFSSKPNKEFMRLQIKRIRHIIDGTAYYECFEAEDALLNFAKAHLDAFNDLPKQYFMLIGALALVNIGAEVTDNVALALKQCVDILEAEVEKA